MLAFSMTDQSCTVPNNLTESYCHWRTERLCYMTAKARGRNNGTNQERWMKLCEQAKTEQDPQKLTEVFARIDRMLANKARSSQGLESPAIFRGV